MAPGVARRARRRPPRSVRSARPVGVRARSAEDWWWDRLAPSGSGYHLLQSDSMLLVLPGPGPARTRVQRRAARRTQRPVPPASRAAAVKARPRPAPVSEPQQGPDPGWGDRIPLEILLQIFGLLVASDGPMPFLGRYPRPIERSSMAQADLLPTERVAEAGGRGRSNLSVHTRRRESTVSHGVQFEPRGPVFVPRCLQRCENKMGQVTPLRKPHSGGYKRPSPSAEIFSQGCTRVPPLARSCLPACALAHRDPVAPVGWPPRQERSQGGEEASRFSGVAYAQSLVSESCPRLTFLKLSDCHGVTPDTLVMLAKACPQLHSLDIQHSMVESTAVVSFLEEAGPRMCKLWLTYSSQTTAILGALLGGCCPQLRVLEVSTGINRNSTPLQLPVEALQKGCPQLQVLRLLNLMWLPKPSGRVVTPGPGFPSLEELCLAGSSCNFVSNEALGRLLHDSPNLRLLDLRGCARITPGGLRDLPCQDLEQLHLGLYGTSDRLTLAKEGSHLLTQKWCHALRELDLSGQGFSEKDLEQALAAFSVTPGASHPALCSLNLRGTRVTPSTVSSVISSCPGLLYLNLESCRCLPRGLKRAYRGQEEVQWCLEQLLTGPPPSS
ncbi:F-box/LRR-repeat protein 6 isoform X2 [Panthera tigris]|uniref:F-box/LRR-repeat protein 6 isoform X2 n=1 Tax=Panthera tigris TaxID=9694 RepID=UPI001C6F6C5C|nr:F-box/LRR-repeat protein 6 isoform X2 [Panthera tigris]